MAREAVSTPKEPAARSVSKLIQSEVAKGPHVELEPLEPVVSEVPVLEPQVQEPQQEV